MTINACHVDQCMYICISLSSQDICPQVNNPDQDATACQSLSCKRNTLYVQCTCVRYCTEYPMPVVHI